MEKGDRVIAICSAKDGIVKLYGEGVYEGHKVPDSKPFNSVGVKNPCIKLDTGKYIWGFQCWWGSKESVEADMGDQKFILVDVEDEVKPFKE